MKSLLVRFINVAVIAVAIVGYNGILTNREKTDEIAKLDAQLESEKLARKNAEEQVAQGKSKDTQADADASEESEGAYKDGTYEGEADGFGGPIQVKVTVENGEITDIEVVSAEKEDGAYLTMAMDVIPNLIEAQSADVDTISGATFSSTGIINAGGSSIRRGGVGRMKKIDVKNLSKKQKKQLNTWLRALIQLLYFLFLPSAFTAAFGGVKYMFTQIGVEAKIELTSFVAVLLVLCAYTIVFGRFFCGFACAFGSLGDALHAIYLKICKKLKKKPVSLKKEWEQWLILLKYVLLAGIVLACFFGVYGNARGTSPWDVFSMIHAGNFRLSAYKIGIAVLILLMIGMAFIERFFCRFFCPMGAIFSLLPILPFFSLERKRESCIKGCSKCTRSCPAKIELREAKTSIVQGECFQCQKCIDGCPKGNVTCGVGILKGNEIGFTVFKAVLLLCLFMWLGI